MTNVSPEMDFLLARNNGIFSSTIPTSSRILPDRLSTHFHRTKRHVFQRLNISWGRVERWLVKLNEIYPAKHTQHEGTICDISPTFLILVLTLKSQAFNDWVLVAWTLPMFTMMYILYIYIYIIIINSNHHSLIIFQQ